MKRIAMLLLVICILCSLTACGAYGESQDTGREYIFGFVKIKQLSRNDYPVYLVYDPNTMVEYMVVQGYQGAWSLCPYYDKDGNVAFYKGE